MPHCCISPTASFLSIGVPPLRRLHHSNYSNQCVVYYAFAIVDAAAAAEEVPAILCCLEVLHQICANREHTVHRGKWTRWQSAVCRGSPLCCLIEGTAS